MNEIIEDKDINKDTNTIIDENKKSQQQDLQNKQIEYERQRENNINRIKQESVNMICRHTELSQEEATKELEIANYDYMIVLNKYFNVEDKKEVSNTTNQQIYGEIRNLMDTGSKNFRIERERTELNQQNQQEDTLKNNDDVDNNDEKIDIELFSKTLFFNSEDDYEEYSKKANFQNAILYLKSEDDCKE
jgi:hypothetical protein